MDPHEVVEKLQILEGLSQGTSPVKRVLVHARVTGWVTDVDLQAKPGEPLYATLVLQGSEQEAPRVVRIPCEIITGIEELP